jgi:hypothetical protein
MLVYILFCYKVFGAYDYPFNLSFIFCKVVSKPVYKIPFPGYLALNNSTYLNWSSISRSLGLAVIGF